MSRNDDNYLRRFHVTDDPDVSLVILPHAGGAASYYYRLSEALSKYFQVYAVQYPGRHDRRREPMPSSLGALATCVREEIGQRVPGKVALLGHSMGAAVAYEIAAQWPKQADSQLVSTFVSARVAPSVPLDLPDVRSTAHAISEMHKLGGTDMRIIADSEFLAAAAETMQKDYALLVEYQRMLDASSGHVIDSPIYALAPTNDDRAPIEKMRQWALNTPKFELRTFAGGHFYINDCIPEIVEYVRESIQLETSRTDALHATSELSGGTGGVR
ncbi:thioesterase II family protein [Nocardia sp. NPDC055002]